MFACQLNEAASLLRLPYTFDAAAQWRMVDAAKNCDAILLAPQISHTFQNVKQALPKKQVWKIPMELFTANNTYKTLQFLDQKTCSSLGQGPARPDFFH